MVFILCSVVKIFLLVVKFFVWFKIVVVGLNNFGMVRIKLLSVFGLLVINCLILVKFLF